MPTRHCNALVPELLVSDLARSLEFWTRLIGFRVRFDSPEDGFAYLALGGAEVMLEARNPEQRQWETGPLPFGRGVNFQIMVHAVAPIMARLSAVGWPLFSPLEDAWYRAADLENGQRQCLVQDPDGYLLRIAENLGTRPVNV